MLKRVLVLMCVLLFAFPIFTGPSVSRLGAEPWGKDADLCQILPVEKASRCHTPFFGQLGETLIRFHQQVISPADGPRSHFLPSSSQYTLDAMRTYGFFYGFLLGSDRLMRENSDPWVYRTTLNPRGQLIKSDPVRGRKAKG